MDQEKNNDNLESFFRRELEHYQEEPGLDMWDKIAIAIPPKPGFSVGRMVALWKFPILLGLLVLSLIFAYFQYQRAEKLDQNSHQQALEIAALQQQMEELDLKFSLAKGKAQEVDLEPSNAKAKVESKTTNQEQANINGIQKQQTIAGTDRPQVQSPIQKSDLIQIATTISPPVALPQPPTIDLSEPQSVPITKRPIDFLHSKQLVQYNKASPLLTVPDLKALRGGYYPRFSVGAWSGNIVVQYYAVDRRVSPATGTSTSVFLSKTSGFSAGIHLDEHWSLHTGLGFRNNGFSLSDQVSLEYTYHNSETNAEGNPVGLYTFTQEGALTFRAQIVNELEQQNPEPIITEGESFTVDFNSAYRLRYYSIPLLVKYQIGQQRFHTYLKGGFIWNKLMRDWAFFPNITFSSGRLTAANPRLTVSAARDNYFEFALAMGVGYNITPRIELALEPSYFQAITSMLNVKPQTYGLRGYINYMF
ncbi:MAG: hypothetical protein DHS20C18_10530 [Saprospiraceae bacterium]|nr:MAG: hypothetical protein DHS20C18_10530 [Saprospiraceae bacterium]